MSMTDKLEHVLYIVVDAFSPHVVIGISKWIYDIYFSKQLFLQLKTCRVITYIISFHKQISKTFFDFSNTITL